MSPATDRRFPALLIALLLVVSLLSAGCVSIRDDSFTYRDPAAIDESKLNLSGYFQSEGNALGRIVLWNDGTAMVAAPVGYGYDGERLSGERFRGYPKWGAFRLQGDSISIQFFDDLPLSMENAFIVYEYNGTILNDSTFVLTEGLSRDEGNFMVQITPFSSSPHSGSWKVSYRYRFRPLSEKPSSENWTDDL